MKYLYIIVVSSLLAACATTQPTSDDTQEKTLKLVARCQEAATVATPTPAQTMASWERLKGGQTQVLYYETYQNTLIYYVRLWLCP